MAYHVHNIPIPPPEKPGELKPPIPDARLEQLRQELINARDLFLSKALDFDKLDAQIINIDGSVVAQQQTLQNHVKEVQETHPYAKEKTLTDGIEELKQEIDNAQPDLSKVAKEQTLTEGLAELRGDDTDYDSLSKLGFWINRVEESVGEVEDRVYEAESNLRGVNIREFGERIPSVYKSGEVVDITADGRFIMTGEHTTHPSIGEVIKASDYYIGDRYKIATHVGSNWRFKWNSEAGAYYISGDITWVDYSPDKLYIHTGIATQLDVSIRIYKEIDPSLKGVLDALDNINIDTTDLAKQGSNAAATNTAILAAIPVECSDEDIDRMFEATSEDGRIIVPSGLITPEGTMPISVFKAITGLTPTE